jgi:hypothetical protein
LKGLPKIGHSSSSTSSNNASHPSTANYSTTTSGSGNSADLVSPTGTLNPTNPSQTHSPNDVIDFKGWPRLQWIVTENLNRPSRDFSLPTYSTPKDIAYIEASTNVEGTVKGVCVSQEAMIAHAKV